MSTFLFRKIQFPKKIFCKKNLLGLLDSCLCNLVLLLRSLYTIYDVIYFFQIIKVTICIRFNTYYSTDEGYTFTNEIRSAYLHMKQVYEIE